MECIYSSSHLSDGFIQSQQPRHATSLIDISAGQRSVIERQSPMQILSISFGKDL